MFAALLTAFLVTRSADAVLTVRHLRQPAIYREANPFMPHTVRRFVIADIALTAVSTCYAITVRRTHRRVAFLVLGAGVGSASVGILFSS